MATQTAGQFYCGDAFGKKWNRKWAENLGFLLHGHEKKTTDRFSQELLDQLLATAFWLVVDYDFGGKVPERVADSCTVPGRPTWDLKKLREELAAVPAKS